MPENALQRRFMTDGLPRVCPMMEGASWDLGAMWYTNYTHVPAGVTVMPDDDPRRTFTDYSDSPGYGPGVYSPQNPWRAPGAAPVNGPCGGYGGNVHGCRHADGTPAPCVIGGTAFGPDAVDYYAKGKLGQFFDEGLLSLSLSNPLCMENNRIGSKLKRTMAEHPRPNTGRNITRTRWQRGSVVEAAYILYSNHAGGYAYRLCRQSGDVTEACFAAGHLAFVGGTHIIQWGPAKLARREIPAVYTTNGTHPAGSMWARGPIPTCAGANGGYVWKGTSAIDCEARTRVPFLPRQSTVDVFLQRAPMQTPFNSCRRRVSAAEVRTCPSAAVPVAAGKSEEDAVPAAAAGPVRLGHGLHRPAHAPAAPLHAVLHHRPASGVGLGRIVAMYCCSFTLYHMH
jgi:hypothetical protein